MIGPESNNHGLTTCKALQRAHYPSIYYQKRLDARTLKETQKVGWYTSRTSKPLMIDELAKALRNGEVEVKSLFAIQELLTYVRDEKGRMGGSPRSMIA